MNEFDEALRSITKGVNEIAGPTNQGAFIITYVDTTSEKKMWKLHDRVHDEAEAVEMAKELQDEGMWSRVTQVIGDDEYEQIWDSGHGADSRARNTEAPPRMRPTLAVESFQDALTRITGVINERD